MPRPLLLPARRDTTVGQYVSVFVVSAVNKKYVSPTGRKCLPSPAQIFLRELRRRGRQACDASGTFGSAQLSTQSW